MNKRTKHCSSGIYEAGYVTEVIYCYLERQNYKGLKFYMNNFSYFEINASIF